MRATYNYPALRSVASHADVIDLDLDIRSRRGVSVTAVAVSLVEIIRGCENELPLN